MAEKKTGRTEVDRAKRKALVAKYKTQERACEFVTELMTVDNFIRVIEAVGKARNAPKEGAVKEEPIA